MLMNIWVKSIVAGLILACGYFFYYENLSGKKDSKFYRVQYVIKVSGDKGPGTGMEDIMNQVIGVIERRAINQDYKVSINRKDLDEIDVVITHARDSLLTRQIVQTNNKLEFRDLYNLSQLGTSFFSISDAVQKFFPENPKAPDSDNKMSGKKNIASLIFFSVDNDGKIINNGVIGKALERDTALITKILHDTAVLKSFPGDIEFCYGVEEHQPAGNKLKIFSLYAIRTKMQEAELQNKHVEYAEAREGFNKQPEIYLHFNNSGSRIWARMTTENKDRNIAIIIDKKVISAPHVNEPIVGGNSLISGGFKMEEAEMLARQLNAGYMPAKLSIMRSDITNEPASLSGRKLMIAAIIFLVTAGLTFFIFNSLKRN